MNQNVKGEWDALPYFYIMFQYANQKIVLREVVHTYLYFYNDVEQYLMHMHIHTFLSCTYIP